MSRLLVGGGDVCKQVYACECEVSECVSVRTTDRSASE